MLKMYKFLTNVENNIDLLQQMNKQLCKFNWFLN